MTSKLKLSVLQSKYMRDFSPTQQDSQWRRRVLREEQASIAFELYGPGGASIPPLPPQARGLRSSSAPRRLPSASGSSRVDSKPLKVFNPRNDESQAGSEISLSRGLHPNDRHSDSKSVVSQAASQLSSTSKRCSSTPALCP